MIVLSTEGVETFRSQGSSRVPETQIRNTVGAQNGWVHWVLLPPLAFWCTKALPAVLEKRSSMVVFPLLPVIMIRVMVYHVVTVCKCNTKPLLSFHCQYSTSLFDKPSLFVRNWTFKLILPCVEMVSEPHLLLASTYVLDALSFRNLQFRTDRLWLYKVQEDWAFFKTSNLILAI